MAEVYENDDYAIDPSKYVNLKREPGKDYDREMLDKLREIKLNAKEKKNAAS